MHLAPPKISSSILRLFCTPLFSERDAGYWIIIAAWWRHKYKWPLSYLGRRSARELIEASILDMEDSVVIPLCAGCWKMLAVSDAPRCLEYPEGIPEEYWYGETRCQKFEVKV